MAYDLTKGWKINQGNSWWGTPIVEGKMTLGGYDNNVTSYGSNDNTSYLVTFSPSTGKLKMENEEKDGRLSATSMIIHYMVMRWIFLEIKTTNGMFIHTRM